jgi:hypothetical protein
MGVLAGELRDKIVAVDPGTGTIQEIASGAEGFGPVSLASRGETLFTVYQGVLSILDPATGEITPIGGTLPNADFDFAFDGFLWGALSANGIPVPGPSGTINQIDPNTGEIVGVAQHDRIMNGGIAIAPPPGVCGAAGPLPIPVVSAGGLVLLAILVAAVGAGVLSKQRRASVKRSWAPQRDPARNRRRTAREKGGSACSCRRAPPPGGRGVRGGFPRGGRQWAQPSS